MTAARLRMPISLLILVLYCAAVPSVGFFVSTAVYLVAHMAFLGIRKPTTLLGVTAAVLLVFFLAIEMFLNVALPRGVLL